MANLTHGLNHVGQVLHETISLWREAFQKQRGPTLPVDQTTGFIMIALILNSIYRYFIRISIAGARIAGA
jgi:hypothetical protein